MGGGRTRERGCRCSRAGGLVSRSPRLLPSSPLPSSVSPSPPPVSPSHMPPPDGAQPTIQMAPASFLVRECRWAETCQAGMRFRPLHTRGAVGQVPRGAAWADKCRARGPECLHGWSRGTRELWGSGFSLAVRGNHLESSKNSSCPPDANSVGRAAAKQQDVRCPNWWSGCEPGTEVIVGRGAHQEHPRCNVPGLRKQSLRPRVPGI